MKRAAASGDYAMVNYAGLRALAEIADTLHQAFKDGSIAANTPRLLKLRELARSLHDRSTVTVEQFDDDGEMVKKN